MLTITAMLVFSFHSFAQDIPVEEEGEAIVIINQSLNGNGPGRDVVSVPIVATLFRTIPPAARFENMKMIYNITPPAN